MFFDENSVEKIQTQLLLQNARQILNVLRATFDKSFAKYSTREIYYNSSLPNRDDFQHQWALAESIINGESGLLEQENTLLEVCQGEFE